MAVRIIRELVDDIDGSNGDETMTFALDGQVYEIDLNEANAKAFREFARVYIENGRKMPKGSIHTASRKVPSARQVGAPAAAGPAERSATYTRMSKDQNKAIREWAKKQDKWKGLSARGRIPSEVVEAFEAAHTK